MKRLLSVLASGLVAVLLSLSPVAAEDKIINEGFDILEKTIAQAIEGATKVA